jgi:signal transduction histidine kinase
MRRRATALVLYAFMAMIGLILLLGGSGAMLLSRYRAETQHVYDSISLRAQLANGMREIVREGTTRMHRVILFENPVERAHEIQLRADLPRDFQAEATKLAGLIESEAERRAYADMVRLADHGWRMQEQILGLLTQGEIDAARDAMLNTVLPVQDEVLEQFGVFSEIQSLQARQLQERLRREYILALRLGAGLAMLTLLAAGAITYALYKRVARAEAEAEESAQAQQRYAAQLEERVAARTQDLVAARDEALRASQAKGLFLANVSHELRTPLSAIIGYCEMMREEAEDRKDAGAIRDLGKIHHASRNLLEMIDAILDRTKIEAGHMPVVLKIVSLRELVDELLDSVRPLADKNRNHLRVDLAISAESIETDRAKLFQTLLNLLANACKFTERGEVRLRIEGPSEVGWIFRVEDTGIGIPPDQLQRIFEPFVQADASTTRRYGGTGLGLAIARDFSSLLGGRIEATSQPGEGACFTLFLPTTTLGARMSPGA